MNEFICIDSQSRKVLLANGKEVNVSAMIVEAAQKGQNDPLRGALSYHQINDVQDDQVVVL